MSCWWFTRSALFSTTRTLSSWPFSVAMVRLNSSEMSSLWASNNKRIISARSANHSMTSTKLYARPTRCFSPDSTPGVSTKITFSRISHGVMLASNRFRNAVPNFVRPRNGMSSCDDAIREHCLDNWCHVLQPHTNTHTHTVTPHTWTQRALPGIERSVGPFMTATKRSVVGSGPMRWLGKSLPSK